MKKNKYIVKFTVPARWGRHNIFLLNQTITCGEDDPTELFHDTIRKACIGLVLEKNGVTVEGGEIDIKMISWIDSYTITN